MLRLLAGFLFFAVQCLVPAVAQEGARPLALGAPVERELAADRTHTYTLRLTTNQIARVIADQRGVDLVLSVVAPDGARLFDVDSPSGAGGEESATIAARQAGIYRVEVRALDASASGGRYVIRVDRFLTETEYLTERLEGLGKLWGAVKFFHPFLAYKPIDWDAALITAIPLVKAARTPAEYRAAISAMLEALADPSTTVALHVAEDRPPPIASAPAREPDYFRTIDGYLVISAVDWARTPIGGGNASARLPQMLAELAKAKGVVIDCRYGDVSPAAPPSFYLRSYLDRVLPSLLQGLVPLGTERYRIHNGYAPQQGSTSGGYTSAFLTQTPGAIGGEAKDKKPLAVLIDERTPDLLPILSGLQAAGAKIVRVGKGSGGAGASVRQMLLPDGVRVNLRVAEFVHPGGGSAFQPDIQLPIEADAGESRIRATIAALNSPTVGKSPMTGNLAAPTMQVQKDNPYPQMAFPSEEHRLLALFRFWNVINYFYPYKQLIDKPWSAVLTDFIPRFLDNRSALDYETTVAEMAARMQDSHGVVRPLQTLNQHLGMFAPPIRLASAGGKLAVVDVLDTTAAQPAGIKRGDVILAIDGEPVAQRLAALTMLRALSTPQSAFALIYPTALRGTKDSQVTLRVEGPDSQTREVELTRTVASSSVGGMLPRKTPVFQVMSNGYGYIDLARLPLADAHKALDAVLNTSAIVFDMRGYPNGTAWALAPRLTDKKNVAAALFRRPLQIATDLDPEHTGDNSADYAFEQKLPAPQGAIYHGKVVMLINEYAISQSEHTCLFFESATNVTFVGSATNGANGDVTSLVLPGNIYVNFTGHDVRHADGTRLQRVGIQPHIKVEPTPTGLSEGRDEVLEAAVKHLDGIRQK